MNLTDRFARLLVCRDKDEFDIWVKEQNAQQLRAAVPGAAEDADAKFVLFLHLFRHDFSRKGAKEQSKRLRPLRL